VGELKLDYSVKPLRANAASEADIAAHADNCKIAAAYEQARIDALELSSRYGATLWAARVEDLQRQLQLETAAFKQTEKAIDRLNAERAAAQTRASERLYASEREFHSLCAKNAELSRVIHSLQAEIDELQQRNGAH
jgi:chromosome segregation ATPase